MPGDPLTDFLQSLPPDKLQAILGAGTADQQQASLERQIAQAHAINQQRMQNQPYGAAAGMAAGLGSVLGGVKEGILQNREQEAIQKRQQGIEAFGQAAQGGNMQGAALLGLLSGNKLLGEMGEGLSRLPMQQAKTEEAQLEAARARRQAAADLDPASAAAILGVANRYGGKIAAGTPIETIRGMLPTIEKGYAAEQGRLSKEDVARITQGLGTGPGGGPHAMGGPKLAKALQALGNDFDPSSGRAGEFGKNQARVNAANRVIALAQDEQGNARDLSPNQMPELAQSVASLIAAGGTGAQAQIEHLLPKSYTRDAAGILQYFTNEPRGAGQQAFVQQFLDTAKREQNSAQQAIDTTRKQRAAKHQVVLRSNPEESRAVLQGFGWDLGPDGMPIMQGAAPKTTTTDTSKAAPQDSQALEWAKANPTDPRAAKILQMLGGAP